MSSVRLSATEQREAILRNARAANREKVRNQALRDRPELANDLVALESEVERRLNLARAAGGRTSQAKRAEEIARAREVLAMVDELVATHNTNTAIITKLRELAQAAA